MTRITIKSLCTAASLLAAGVFNTQAQEDLAKYVDPMIGTAKMGHTYPGATVPFGSVQLFMVQPVFIIGFAIYFHRLNIAVFIAVLWCIDNHFFTVLKL